MSCSIEHKGVSEKLGKLRFEFYGFTFVELTCDFLDLRIGMVFSAAGLKIDKPFRENMSSRFLNR